MDSYKSEMHVNVSSIYLQLGNLEINRKQYENAAKGACVAATYLFYVNFVKFYVI